MSIEGSVESFESVIPRTDPKKDIDLIFYPKHKIKWKFHYYFSDAEIPILKVWH